MILKEADDRSADIAELKRLKEATPPTFHAAIQKQIDQIYSGLEGEKNAAHFLKREFGKSESVAILHDLRLELDGDCTQIDHLLIHRVQAAAWVLETKNYSGRMTCDAHGDWTVWYGRKPRPIPSPINQARRQCAALRSWLDAQDIRSIRAIQPVVLISPTSSVDRSQLTPDIHVVKSDNFGPWWNEQVDQISIGKIIGMVGRHVLSGMSPNDFQALGQRLVGAHVPPSYNWRSILSLPVAAEQSAGSQNTPGATLTEGAAEPNEGDTSVITTPFGKVTIKRIPDGRYALRNDKNDALIDLVKGACRRRGQWNPRFRNWLIEEGDLATVVEALTSAARPA